jgi:GNAT superfamily N-acetyltransferase
VEAVRGIEAGDLDRCHELVAAAMAAAKNQRGGALLMATQDGNDPAASLLTRWRADTNTEVIVGTYSDAIVGIGAGTVGAIGPRAVGRIECFYVEPDARAVGVGGAMVEHLVAWLATRGCRDIDALALPGDRTSKQLLESSGFKARLLILHRSLD